MNKKATGFSVAPSPFNSIKLELGVIIVLLPLVWGLVHVFISSTLLQFIALAGFSAAASLWLLFRIYRLQQRLIAKAGFPPDSDISNSEGD